MQLWYLGLFKSLFFKNQDYGFSVWSNVLGTFTLSNLGMFGVDRFDAILPPGQVSHMVTISNFTELRILLKLWEAS